MRPRSGLRIGIKLGLLLAAFGILASGLTGYYTYTSSRAMLLAATERDLLTATQVLGRRLQVALGEVARDARLLANLAASAEIAGGNDGPLAERRKSELADTFTAMLGVHPEYFQVRLIGADRHGLELVRVDRDAGAALRVAAAELQEKAHYPYVFDSLRLPRGGIYLSKIAINHEEGAHAGLGKPTLRVATPVFGGDGRALASIVVNIDLNGLFELLKADLPASYRLYLSNERGDFLIHPEPEKTFAFDRGQRILVQDSFAAVAALIDGKAHSVVTQHEEARQKPNGVIAAFLRLPFGEVAENRFVMLGLSQPLTEILAETTRLGSHVIQIVLGFSLLAIVLSGLVSRAVTGPLDKIVRAARRFSKDHAISDLPLARKDEIGLLARSFLKMQRQILAHLAELDESRNILDHLARHDPLTGLPNRRMFFDRLEHAIANSRRSGKKLAVLFIDLDRFKEINDSLGHALGDAVLKSVAGLLKATVREGDTVARLGGDEFIILFDTLDDALDVESIAQKLHERFQTALQIDGHELLVYASIGISLFPRDGKDSVELVHNADLAMYRSKKDGRNTYSFHDSTESRG